MQNLAVCSAGHSPKTLGLSAGAAGTAIAHSDDASRGARRGITSQVAAANGLLARPAERLSRETPAAPIVWADAGPGSGYVNVQPGALRGQSSEGRVMARPLPAVMTVVPRTLGVICGKLPAATRSCSPQPGDSRQRLPAGGWGPFVVLGHRRRGLKRIKLARHGEHSFPQAIEPSSDAKQVNRHQGSIRDAVDLGVRVLAGSVLETRGKVVVRRRYLLHQFA